MSSPRDPEPPVSLLYLADLEGRRNEKVFDDWRPRRVDAEGFEPLLGETRARVGEKVIERMSDFDALEATALEAAWRGLERLVGERTGTARIEAMGISLDLVREDFEEVPGPDKTSFYEQLYARQWYSGADASGRLIWPKGWPFAAVLVAYPLAAEDLDLVAQLAEVASRSAAVLVVDGRAFEREALGALPGSIVLAAPAERPELAVAEVGAAFLRGSLSHLETASGEPLALAAFRHRLFHALARIELSGRREPFETRVAALREWLASPASGLSGA
ncbi:MAG: type VI secretion system contractile sheath large subunit, partial [Myxococcales bacterium]|nr:type VI secretion system contractile sheath large subunit [Myxococcales bacterium]